MEGEGTSLVLRSSVRMRVTALALMTLPAFLLTIGITGAVGERARFLPIGVMGLALFGAIAWVTGMAKWSIDDDGIQRLTPLTPHTRLRWGEVVSVHEQSLGNLTFGRGYGRLAIQVPNGLAGMETLIRVVLARCPASAFSDATRRSLEKRIGAAPPVTMIPVDAPEPVVQPRGDAVARWKTNPFFALGLDPKCSQADVERAGQKLLALLAIGSAGAKRFATPVGEMERTEDIVRAAMAELRDPDKRIGHELWARIAIVPSAPASGKKEDDPARPWPEAMIAIRWRGP
jgi:hypothetical protein